MDERFEWIGVGVVGSMTTRDLPEKLDHLRDYACYLFELYLAAFQ